DAPILQRLPVGWMRRGQTPGAREDLRQQTPTARNVQDDQYGGADISRQVRDNAADCFHAACGGANDDDVVLGHTMPLRQRCVHHLFQTLAQVYRRTCVAQNSANGRTSLGGLVWWGRTPSQSGVKQNVTVTSKGSSASI